MYRIRKFTLCHAAATPLFIYGNLITSYIMEDPRWRLLTNQRFSSEDFEKLDSYFTGLRGVHVYISVLGANVRKQLYQSFSIMRLNCGQTLFSKGSFLNTMYIVLEGALELLGVAPDGRTYPLDTLRRGDVVGEKELMRSSLTTYICQVTEPVVLATLSLQHFRSLLGSLVAAEITERIKFLEKYLPFFKGMIPGNKERVAFMMRKNSHPKHHCVLGKGELTHELFLLKTGECAVMKPDPRLSKVLVTISEGCSFGEEGVFLNLPCLHDVKVTSEHADIYVLRQEAIRLLPSDTAEALRMHYNRKTNTRFRPLKATEPAPLKQRMAKPHPLATSYAQHSVASIFSRSFRLQDDDSRDRSGLLKAGLLSKRVGFSFPNRHSMPVSTRSMLVNQSYPQLASP